MSPWLTLVAMLPTVLPPGGESAAPANDSIRQRDLKADLTFLAGDSFRGRLTGTRENDLASEFIAARFQRLGLKPVAPGGSYYQRFHLDRATLGAANALKVEGGDVTLRFAPRADFVPQRFSPTAEARGRVAFVGFGISAPELGHDDYKGVDVRGKIVLALNHEPGEKDPNSPFDGVVSSEAGNSLRKAITAQEKGAVGILFVADVHNPRDLEDFGAAGRTAWPDQPPRIFNGADDNGSGTVGMLEIAEAYALAAEARQRPARSVLFAAFNSEERGLLGSWAFVERPPVPLDRIAAVLNMDMIGRDEEVPEGGGPRFRGLPVQTAESNRDAFNLLGWSRSASLTEVVERANQGIGLRIKKVLDNNVSNLLRRSDQWPFLQSGVPAVFFHTGLHPDYHTVDDRPEKIRYEKMERIARLVHQASWDLAQQPGRPRLDRAAPAARGSAAATP
jgi:hypothetical protein